MAKKRNRQQINAIQPGFRLHWYEIREIIGQGGFGITYLAYDHNLAHEVAIKEYMPIDLAARAVDSSVACLSQEHDERYRWGLDRFIEEARTIGQFKHPNIVRVRNVFEANNTAYMVMDYELGESLQEILSRRKILDEDDIATVLHPIVDGMKLVHAHGFIHRDVKPANIFIRVDGDPVLLDFGSARQALETSRASLTSLFSKGYAPIEQYNTQDEQGPWTDIYALGATMYRAIAGVPPADAIDRSSAMSLAGRDTYVPAVEVGAGRYSPALLESIDWAMRFKRNERPQSITEWQAVLYGRQTMAEQTAEHAAEAAQANEAAGRMDLLSETATYVPDAIPGDTPAAASPQPALQPVPAADAGDEDSDTGGIQSFESELARAKSGDVEAQAQVAFMYAKGIGTALNEAEAVAWYRNAANQGHAPSQYNLGVMYAKGRGVAKDLAQAYLWYHRAAEQGDARAQATVANMCLKGLGTEKDLKAAHDWSLRAAKRGHQNSMFNLGELYMQGLGVQQNFREAYRWYRKAADRGHVNAQINLGYMYGKGQGVDRNDSEAYQWYLRAAEAGNPNAQYNLGVIYSKGRGVARNINEAKKWYRLAAEQGVANAERALSRLEAR